MEIITSDAESVTIKFERKEGRGGEFAALSNILHAFSVALSEDGKIDRELLYIPPKYAQSIVEEFFALPR